MVVYVLGRTSGHSPRFNINVHALVQPIRRHYDSSLQTKLRLGGALLCTNVTNYNHLNIWPLQFLRTGFYRFAYGYVLGHTVGGNWWSNTANSIVTGRRLYSWVEAVFTQYSYWSGNGLALRCGAPAIFSNFCK